jgi:hypothetical protein
MTMRATGPGGIVINFPDGTDPETINRVMNEAVSGQGRQPQPPTGDVMQAQAAPLNWSDIPGQMAKNAIPSAIQFGKDLMQPIMHPIQTGQNLLDVAEGGLQHLGDAIAGRDEPPTPEQQKASALAQFFKDRYGNTEKFKHTLATDPVGTLSDASALLTGGGTAVAKVPVVGSKLSTLAKTAGTAIDPLTYVAKPAAEVTRHTVGALTGTGPDALRIASEAGAANGPRGQAFRENMRGQVSPDVLLIKAKGALATLRRQKHNRYLQNISRTKANQATIDMVPIIQDYVDLLGTLRTKGGPIYNRKGQQTSNQIHWKIDKAEQDLIYKIDDLLTEWRNDPATHTAIGLDGLKQRIQSLMPVQPTPQTSRIVTSMSDSVKKAIEAQEPTYKAAMKDYETSSALEREIEKTLSLGHNVSSDTTIRKLISSLRNNVNTNYGKRKRLVDELNRKSPGLNEALAGQMFNSWMPRGMQGAINPIGFGSLAVANLDPKWLAGLAASSPRLMGETAYYAGKFGPRRNVAPFLFQSGRAYDEQRRNQGQY